MASKSTRFEKIYREIRDDLFAFCGYLGFEPTWQQAQVFNAVMDAQSGKGSNWIAVKSGQGPGKTTCSGIVGLWRTLRSVDAMTVVTAPTMRQCRDVWLAELRRTMEDAHPLISNFVNITATKVEIAKRRDWCVRTVTATKEENAQGYHQENMTVICEEASGIPRGIIEQFKGTLSNPDALFLLIGNPNTRDCAFFDCFNSARDRWKCITLNAEDTAKDYPHIVSPQRNLDLEQEFGRQSDVYRVRVLGEFPHADPNCVISSEDCEKVAKEGRVLECAGFSNAKQIGIDFARYGSDESVVYRRSGESIVEWQRFSKVDPSAVVAAAFRWQHEAGWRDDECWYVVDAGGIGQGIMHKFYDANKRVVEFHNGGTAVKSRMYANRITEAWFTLARKISNGTVSIPNDNILIQQLSSRQYKTDNKGRLILEKKEDYMKRGPFPSPDRADTLVMAFYDELSTPARISTRHKDEQIGSRNRLK
jgi:phage terminase large subunit